MASRTTLVLTLALVAGCPSEIPPPPPPPPPPLPPCEALLQGRTARVEPAPEGIPAVGVATVGRLADREIALGDAGNAIWIAGEEGATRFSLDGPALPIGARFLAVIDWNLGAYDEPAAIPALVSEGHGEACLFDGREPISLEDAAGLAAAPDAGALAATLALRYLKTCPASPDECVLYGAPAAVERARDPEEPPGGFFVRPHELAAAPEDLEYETVALAEDGEPGGSSGVYRLVKSGSIQGWGVELARASTEDGAHDWVRLSLKKRRTRVHAFDIDLGGQPAQLVAHLHADGDRLVLWVAWPELGFTLSVHGKRDGALQGEPISFGLSSYYDLGPNGIEGVGLFPVLGAASVGAALWAPASSDGVLYAEPSSEPEWLPVDAMAEPGPEGGLPRFFTVVEEKLVGVW